MSESKKCDHKGHDEGKAEKEEDDSGKYQDDLNEQFSYPAQGIAYTLKIGSMSCAFFL